MLKILVFAAGAAALLGVASSTSAEPGAAQPPTISVRYADLDLSDPQGARAMVRRVRHAAVQVCRRNPWNVGSDIGAIERFDQCYRQALRQAATALDRPEVYAAAGLAPSPPHAAR